MSTSLLLALALLVAPAAPADQPAPAAQPRHPLTLDDLLALPRVGDPDLSPDGALVAFTVGRTAPDGAGLQTSIWVVSTRGGEPRRLTAADGKARAPRFSPDGIAINLWQDHALAWVVASRGNSMIAERRVDCFFSHASFTP